MADAREAITADDSGQEHWNSSLSDHPHRPGINNQEEERLLSQFQNLLLTLAKEGKLDDEGEGFVPEDASRDPWDGHRDREDQVEGWGESLEILRDDLAYPLRPGIVNCGHYLRTGTCKFGASCKFNHPPTRTIPDGQKKVVLDGSKEFVKKQGLVECKFYKTAGGCKHGNSCRYKHTDLEASDPSDVELNFLGLPLRPGTKECQYYMRNGTCKFAANCRFNHPDPTDVKESDISSGLCNIMSSATQSFLQQDEWEDSGPFFPAGSPPKLVPQQDGWEDSGPFFPTGSPPKLVPQQDGWEDSGPFFPTGSLTKLEVPQQDGWEDSGPFFPTGSPTKLEVPVEHSTSNSYQVPRYTSGRSIHQPLPYSTGDTLGDIGSASEYPERPGQPDCSFFLKTGNCKFKSNCRYNHPKDRLSILPQTKLNHKDLPLRPGQIPCSHYIHHGICKFGQTCKFDHPGQ